MLGTIQRSAIHLRGQRSERARDRFSGAVAEGEMDHFAELSLKFFGRGETIW